MAKGPPPCAWACRVVLPFTHLFTDPLPHAASQGFVAKPVTLPDGTQDILNWEVVIPGKDGTLWEGARIPMTMQFSEDYPNKPPVCKFKLLSNGKPLFHPNVYPSGKICLSLLDAEKGAAAHALLAAHSRSRHSTARLAGQKEPHSQQPHARNSTAREARKKRFPPPPSISRLFRSAGFACPVCSVEAVAHDQTSPDRHPDAP